LRQASTWCVVACPGRAQCVPPPAREGWGRAGAARLRVGQEGCVPSAGGMSRRAHRVGRKGVVVAPRAPGGRWGQSPSPTRRSKGYSQGTGPAGAWRAQAKCGPGREAGGKPCFSLLPPDSRSRVAGGFLSTAGSSKHISLHAAVVSLRKSGGKATPEAGGAGPRKHNAGPGQTGGGANVQQLPCAAPARPSARTHALTSPPPPPGAPPPKSPNPEAHATTK
jgi:hypothetical protein